MDKTELTQTLSLKDVATEWIRYADMDLLTSQTMFKHYPPPVEVICYHAGQCAEKVS